MGNSTEKPAMMPVERVKTVILAENLIQALGDAIQLRAGYERRSGYTGDSAYLSGLKDAYNALVRGEPLEVRR